MYVFLVFGLRLDRNWISSSAVGDYLGAIIGSMAVVGVSQGLMEGLTVSCTGNWGDPQLDGGVHAWGWFEGEVLIKLKI